MFAKIMKSLLGKTALASTVLGGVLVFAGAPAVRADDRGRNDRHEERFERRDDYRGRETFERRREVRPDRDDYRRFVWRDGVRGYYDRFGCWHRC